jgi:hypothetical protein
VKRRVGYSWQLRDVMAQNRIYTATELVPLLHDRGINLSASQVHRLVSGTPERLDGIADEGHAQVVRRFATWDVLPRLRAQAERKPITAGARRHADEQVKRAMAFLRWLSGIDLTLASCRQAHIDAWHAENNQAARHVTRAFLQWCMTSGLTRRFQLPPAPAGHTAPMPGEERIAHLGRVLTADDLPLRTRAAAAIVLLYAQPASRIVRLSLDDVIRDGGEVLLRLGEPPRGGPRPLPRE